MSFLPNESSRASIVLGFVREHMHDVGASISYSEMLALIELDTEVADVSTLLSGVVAEVNKRLHRDGDWRHLANVPTAGYRIASPEDLRSESMARMRRSQQQQVANIRAIEKVVRHPDATVEVRKRASDASAAQGAFLQVMSHHAKKVRVAWPSSEQSPVAGQP